MKMLTGLLPVTEGEALLFGHHLDANDMATRQHIGYMSQSFSLYNELTVRQKPQLHSHLFRLPVDEEARVREMLERFDLLGVADSRPESLPLGQRQRLQLAVAVLHQPEVLILDEPTSGVDPVARDGFWRYLISLSRDEGVTIFVSTHFMNEAERCDRISLMNAGKVLGRRDTPGTGAAPRHEEPRGSLHRVSRRRRRLRSWSKRSSPMSLPNPPKPSLCGSRAAGCSI